MRAVPVEQGWGRMWTWVFLAWWPARETQQGPHSFLWQTSHLSGLKVYDSSLVPGIMLVNPRSHERLCMMYCILYEPGNQRKEPQDPEWAGKRTDGLPHWPLRWHKDKCFMSISLRIGIPNLHRENWVPERLINSISVTQLIRNRSKIFLFSVEMVLLYSPEWTRIFKSSCFSLLGYFFLSLRISGKFRSFCWLTSYGQRMFILLRLMLL